MARHLLIRDENGQENIVQETALLAEKSLHDVLTQHPELIPADDLEIGEAVVVGRESGLDTGYADLVLLDRSAQICLVEVKKEGNPDTRRVIAQLLDYAASLWQMSADTFEHDVLHPYLRFLGTAEQDLNGLAEFAAERFQSQGEDSEEAFDDFSRRLEQNLASGKFRLLVVAPSIPPGVQQVIEYMNAQGLLIYGLEVSFFNGPAECFVPRLVVKPRVTETRRLAASSSSPIAAEDFFQALPDRAHDPAAELLRRAESAGATIRWNTTGPSILGAQPPHRVVCLLEKKRLAIVIKASSGYPPGPFDAARMATERLHVGSISSDEWSWGARFEDLSDDQMRAAFDIATELIDALAVSIAYEPLDPPITVEFERNDHNIWAKSVAGLADHVGDHLRGELCANGSPAGVPVTLAPLAGGAQGWRPRFDSPAAESVWPPDRLNGDYEITVTDVGTVET